MIGPFEHIDHITMKALNTLIGVAELSYSLIFDKGLKICSLAMSQTVNDCQNKTCSGGW